MSLLLICYSYLYSTCTIYEVLTYKNTIGGIGGSYTVSFEKICRQNRVLTIAREKNKPVKIFTKLKANLSNGIVWKIFVRLHNCKDKNAEDRDKKNKIKDRYISQFTLYCTFIINIHTELIVL